MRATGIVRRMDDLGRVVIPKEIRRRLELVEKESKLDIFVDRDFIVLSTKQNGGISRGLDELGRVVIPVELRRTMNLEEREALQIFTEGEDIYLKKYSIGCSQCGEMKNTITVGNVTLCPVCAKAMFDVISDKTSFLD